MSSKIKSSTFLENHWKSQFRAWHCCTCGWKSSLHVLNRGLLDALSFATGLGIHSSHRWINSLHSVKIDRKKRGKYWCRTWYRVAKRSEHFEKVVEQQHISLEMPAGPTYMGMPMLAVRESIEYILRDVPGRLAFLLPNLLVRTSHILHQLWGIL